VILQEASAKQPEPPSREPRVGITEQLCPNGAWLSVFRTPLAQALKKPSEFADHFREIKRQAVNQLHFSTMSQMVLPRRIRVPDDSLRKLIV
jgi:hypothetical protein